jgi:hypothetical protein
MADERRVDADLGFAREPAPTREEMPSPADDGDAYEDAWYQVLKAASALPGDDDGEPDGSPDGPGGASDPS